MRVTITPGRARYELLDGEPIAVVHHGKEFQLGKRPNEHDIPKVKVGYNVARAGSVTGCYGESQLTPILRLNESQKNGLAYA